jgi:hypothetical protein
MTSPLRKQANPRQAQLKQAKLKQAKLKQAKLPRISGRSFAKGEEASIESVQAHVNKQATQRSIGRDDTKQKRPRSTTAVARGQPGFYRVFRTGHAETPRPQPPKPPTPD